MLPDKLYRIPSIGAERFFRREPEQPPGLMAASSLGRADIFNSTFMITGRDDGDAFQDYKGTGTNPLKFDVYAHPGFMVAVACSSYAGSGACAMGYPGDPTLHAKVQWCNYLSSIDGASTTAWNASWGSGSYYTSFGSAGGYGTGTGCLHQDGLHGGSSAWIGTDPWNLNGATNVKRDMDNFFIALVTYDFTTEINVISRRPDGNFLFVQASTANGRANAIGYCLPAGHSLAATPVKATGTNMYATIIEADATSPIVSEYIGGNSSVANQTLYTVPASTSAVPLGTVYSTNANSIVALECGVATNGTATTFTDYAVPTGGSAGATNEAFVSGFIAAGSTQVMTSASLSGGGTYVLKWGTSNASTTSGCWGTFAADTGTH